MEVKSVSTKEYSSFLQNFQHTIFHESWWLESVIKGIKRFGVDLWGIYDKDSLIAVMPILYWRFGFKVVRHYLTPYLGPVFSSCVLGLMDDVFSLEDFSYFMYFGQDVIAAG
jgi:hypothetical protein